MRSHRKFVWSSRLLGCARRCLGPVTTALLMVVVACGEDVAVAPPPAADVAQRYWTLNYNHHAVTLSIVAPYDTLQLTATPRNANGEPLSGLPAPVFTTTDRDRVQVGVDGVLHAIKTGNRVAVVAALSAGNVTHTDTVYVTVTNKATPPVLAGLSIHPVSPDSAKVAMYGSATLRARAWDPDSVAINGLAVAYASSDPTVATIDRTRGTVTPVRPGHVTFVAVATAYGITKADTLPYMIGLPLEVTFTIDAQQDAQGHIVNGFVPSQLSVGTGGTVIWQNQNHVPTDVTFDDPTDVVRADLYCTYFGAKYPFFCDDGNIAAFGVPPDPNDPMGNIFNNGRARSFPVPGTYRFHSTLFGTTGTIVVVDERPTS